MESIWGTNRKSLWHLFADESDCSPWRQVDSFEGKCSVRTHTRRPDPQSYRLMGLSPTPACGRVQGDSAWVASLRAATAHTARC